MKKNRVALILVLSIVCSYPVFSNEEGCEGTREFAVGVGNGSRHRAGGLGWGLLGLGLTSWGSILINQIQIPGLPKYFYLLGPGIGTAISIALPLAIKPQPKDIVDNIPEEKLECYLAGYGRAARRRNITVASIGCAVGWGVFVYSALFSGAW